MRHVHMYKLPKSIWISPETNLVFFVLLHLIKLIFFQKILLSLKMCHTAISAPNCIVYLRLAVSMLLNTNVFIIKGRSFPFLISSVLFYLVFWRMNISAYPILFPQPFLLTEEFQLWKMNFTHQFHCEERSNKLLAGWVVIGRTKGSKTSYWKIVRLFNKFYHVIDLQPYK